MIRNLTFAPSRFIVMIHREILHNQYSQDLWDEIIDIFSIAYVKICANRNATDIIAVGYV